MSHGPPDGGRPPPRGPEFDFLHEAVADAGAVGFVAVGRDGADLRYLTGRSTDRERALVVTGTGAALSLPPATPFADETALPAVDATGERRGGDPSAGQHAVSLLAELTAGGVNDGRDDGGSDNRTEADVRDGDGEGGEHDGDGEGDVRDARGGTVLVPRDLPHDAAIRLDRAGYAVVSTRAVADARTRKTDAERDRLRDAQAVAAAGVGRAARLLDGPRKAGADDPIDERRVRREASAALTTAGAVDTERTRVAVGGPTDAAAPVVVALAPRLAGGYRGRLVRTLAPRSDGGWERRAHVAVTSALRVAAAELDPGVDADAVRREATAELGSFGFASSDGPDGPSVDATVDVHGVGVAAREPPLPERGDPVPEDAVVAVDAGILDAEQGTVRIADLFAVGEDGGTVLGDVSRSLDPTVYRAFDPLGDETGRDADADPGSELGSDP